MDRRRLIAVAFAAAPAAAAALSAAPARAASGGKERKKGGGAAFLQLPTLTAVIARADGRRGVLTVEAGVDAGAAFDKAQAIQPRLRDAFNTALARYAAGLRPGYAPDADLLARELQLATDRAMGKPGTKLLLGSIIVN